MQNYVLLINCSNQYYLTAQAQINLLQQQNHVHQTKINRLSVTHITKQHVFYYALRFIWRQHYTARLWRRPGFFKVEVKGLKLSRHQSSCVSLMHTADSLNVSSGWASRDSILTKQITIWHKAPTATHICLAVLENRTETARLQSALRHNKVWHYIYADIFFPTVKKSKAILSSEW